MFKLHVLTLISLTLAMVAVGCSSSDQTTDQTTDQTFVVTGNTDQTTKEAEPRQPTTVDIDELVDLAKENILAADQYKGQYVQAEGIVISVKDGELFVGGLIETAQYSASGMFDLVDMVHSGFRCHYSESFTSKAIQLRSGDNIAVAGQITGWKTVFGNVATLEPCAFRDTLPTP
jgi:hypothetical protein